MPIRTGEQLTTIKALNTMASYIGIPPINSLSDVDGFPDFKIAQEVLDEITQVTLSLGLPCNQDYEYQLTEVNIDGNVVIPDGALICDLENPQYTERDGLVYDLKNKTNVTDTSLKAHIIWYQTFDALPELVKRYIITASSRALVARIKGDQGLQSLTLPDERRTKQEFDRYRFHMGDVSLLDHPDVDYISRRKTYRRRRYY
jgi:hypothetical protein